MREANVFVHGVRQMCRAINHFPKSKPSFSPKSSLDLNVEESQNLKSIPEDNLPCGFPKVLFGSLEGKEGEGFGKKEGESGRNRGY